MAATDSLAVFIVSLLIGGLGIYVGASVLAGARSYTHAVVTAGIGALVWSITSSLFGGLPTLGTVLTLLAYVAVIKWRYRTGWVTAGGIALVAWVAAIAVLEVLAYANITDYSALGIPNV